MRGDDHWHGERAGRRAVQGGFFVQAQNTKTKITVNVLSHKDGVYRVEDLPAGEYVLRIRAVGYQADLAIA